MLIFDNFHRGGSSKVEKYCIEYLDISCCYIPLKGLYRKKSHGKKNLILTITNIKKPILGFAVYPLSSDAITNEQHFIFIYIEDSTLIEWCT